MLWYDILGWPYLKLYDSWLGFFFPILNILLSSLKTDLIGRHFCHLSAPLTHSSATKRPSRETGAYTLGTAVSMMTQR